MVKAISPVGLAWPAAATTLFIDWPPHLDDTYLVRRSARCASCAAVTLQTAFMSHPVFYFSQETRLSTTTNRASKTHWEIFRYCTVVILLPECFSGRPIDFCVFLHNALTLYFLTLYIMFSVLTVLVSMRCVIELPLTFRPKICSTGYSCPCFHWMKSFYGFPVSKKS